MVLLSYDVPTVTNFIEKGERWDTEFIDCLEKNNVTYVDFLQKATNEYKAFNISTEDFGLLVFLIEFSVEIISNS